MNTKTCPTHPLTKQIGSVTDVVLDLNHTLDSAIVHGADCVELENLNTTIQTLMSYRDRLVAIQNGAFASQQS